MIWRILYNILAAPALKLVLLIAGLFSEKVRRGIKGRMGEGDRLRGARARCQEGSPRVLVHCASAGELESAIPIIREMKRQSDVCIILSYYSPSAVNRVAGVDEISDHIYLPFDSPRRVRRLLDIIDPSLILVIKHDLWPNLVWQAKKRNVPVVLANAYSRRDSMLLRQRMLIPFSRELNGSLAEIHAVTESDASRWRFLSGRKVDVLATGDTRFDRVRERALNSAGDQGELKRRLSGMKVFVAGSTWPVDEKMFHDAWQELSVEGRLLMLVPHEIGEEHLSQIEQDFAEFGVVRLSQLKPDNRETVLLVDQMGILAGLYGLGVGAYVGGGFGVGVHSVIEPAVFGIPVSFGPKYEMSPEAKELKRRKGAELIEDGDALKQFMAACLEGQPSHLDIGKCAGEFVEEKAGVTRNLVTHLTQRYLTISG